MESAYHYDQFNDAIELAAWTGFALAKGHCFVDGNKRTSLQALDATLIVHGINEPLPQEAIAEAIEKVADGGMTRDEFVEAVIEFVVTSVHNDKDGEGAEAP